MFVTYRTIWRLALMAVATSGWGTDCRAQSFDVFRYDDNVSQFAAPASRQALYCQLKYIPLGSGADEYLILWRRVARALRVATGRDHRLRQGSAEPIRPATAAP